MKPVEKRTDNYSVRSEQSLKLHAKKTITSVFVQALKCIELKFGKNFEGYEQLRSEILRAGNNAIRDLSDVIGLRFNVEEIPEVLTVRFKQDLAEQGKEN